MEPAKWTTEYWVKRWETNDIGWHKPVVDSYLAANSHELFGDRQQMKVFVPLSGKCVDVKWMADLGHKVIGVELSALSIEAFFKEQSISYTTEKSDKLEDVTVYASEDSRIRIYCCDLFRFNSSVEGQFDAVWDMGSIIALNPADRARYSQLIVSLMAPNCRMLVKTVEYNEIYYSGPPSSVTQGHLAELYGLGYSVKQLDKRDETERGRKTFTSEFDYFGTALYLITQK